MKIPDSTYDQIRERIWGIADSREWQTLSAQQRSSFYEEWIRDGEVGGVLSRYLDPGSIRVYIKDTIMKPYVRERTKDLAPILRLLGLPQDSQPAGTYVKPHGCRFADGRVMCWGPARDWKSILLAVFQRAHLVRSAVPYAAVMMSPAGKYQQPEYRNMIGCAAERLGIQQLVWYDP